MSNIQSNQGLAQAEEKDTAPLTLTRGSQPVGPQHEGDHHEAELQQGQTMLQTALEEGHLDEAIYSKDKLKEGDIDQANIQKLFQLSAQYAKLPPAEQPQEEGMAATASHRGRQMDADQPMS